MNSPKDTLGRPVGSLRVSVTDRCNLRCRYCMPENAYVWLDRKDLLSYEEITEIVNSFTLLGVNKVRLTGGEPLLRRDIDELVNLLSRNPRLLDLALTTNGVLLTEHARRLNRAGLHRLTVSLDTLRPERFARFTRRDQHAHAIRGIFAAREAGFKNIKINAVVIRGFNEDELADLLRFGGDVGAEVRFIEYMDVGGATRWSMDDVISSREILLSLKQQFGPIRPVPATDAAPAARYMLPDGTVFGLISSTTQPFCRACDRTRLTVDGMWFLCLYAERGIDLKKLLRDGHGHAEIARVIADHWQARTDRGAEQRLNVTSRTILYQPEELKEDPHREMHLRGG